MGGSVSRRASSRQPYSSHSWSHHSYPQAPYAQPSQEYVTHQHYPPPPQSYGGRAPDSRRRLERKYSKIEDNYNSLEQVRYSFLFLSKRNCIAVEDKKHSQSWMQSVEHALAGNVLEVCFVWDKQLLFWILKLLSVCFIWVNNYCFGFWGFCRVIVIFTTKGNYSSQIKILVF